jgi:hypothetical protein
MLEIIIGCMFPMLLTTDNVSEVKECVQVADNLNHVIEYAPLISDYFAEADILQALGVIYCESSGRTNVWGYNTNGTADVGLWQFNDNTWAWLKPKLNIIEDRTNARTATYVAAWLVYNDGWHHWNSSKQCWKGTSNERLYIQLSG